MCIDILLILNFIYMSLINNKLIILFISLITLKKGNENVCRIYETKIKITMFCKRHYNVIRH